MGRWHPPNRSMDCTWGPGGSLCEEVLLRGGVDDPASGREPLDPNKTTVQHKVQNFLQAASSNTRNPFLEPGAASSLFCLHSLAIFLPLIFQSSIFKYLLLKTSRYSKSIFAVAYNITEDIGRGGPWSRSEPAPPPK